MRIDFSKQIRSTKGLEEFFQYCPEQIRRSSEFFSFFNSRYARLKCDIRGIYNRFREELQTELVKAGFDPRETAANVIWVSSPEKFSVFLDCRDRYPGYTTDPHLDKDNWELAEIRDITKQKLFGRSETRKVKVYRAVPKIEILGKVAFERLENVDPNPVLNLLSALKYGSRVITTPEEVEKELAKARQTYHSPPSSKEEPSENYSTGTIAGAVAGAVEGGIEGAIVGGAIGSLFDE